MSMSAGRLPDPWSSKLLPGLLATPAPSRPPSRWAIIAVASLAMAFIPSLSHAAQAALGCPGTVQAGAQFVTEVTIDVGTTPLGAYSIAVTYDPAVLTVASVAGGSTAQFSGSPTTNTPTPGTTNISAFQSSSLTLPTGVVSVAMITFNVVATASTITAISLTATTNTNTTSTTILPTTTTTSTMSAISTTTTSTTTTPTSTTTTTSTSTTTTTQPPTTTTTSSTTTT